MRKGPTPEGSGPSYVLDSLETAQAFGRLPWLAPLFLRVRRLRARLLIGTPEDRTNSAVILPHPARWPETAGAAQPSVLVVVVVHVTDTDRIRDTTRARTSSGHGSPPHERAMRTLTSS